MNFDEILACFIGTELGGSANRSDAQYFKRLLEDNKNSLDIENSSLSDKLYLYLLFYIDPKQKSILEIVRRAKKPEDLSDNDMIDVFNDLIAQYGNLKYKRDRLTTYFLSFKTEIDKRPMVGANLVLAGFDIVAKTQTVIKDDQDYARFVDRGKSFPTKQYIKYLTEDNIKYFDMQNILVEKKDYSYEPSITLIRCRNIELIKNNYHLYLMYCLGHDDIEPYPTSNPELKIDVDPIIQGETLTELFNKHINNDLLRTLQTDIKRKKFDLAKAKKFISFFKDKILSGEYEVLKDRLLPKTNGHRGLGFDWQTIRTGGGWFNSKSEKTGKIEVRGYWYYREQRELFIARYAYVLLALLYLFKSDIVDDIKKTLDTIKASFLYCSSSDDWKQKNKLFYSNIYASSDDMNNEFSGYWNQGGKVSDYILKYEFNEKFTEDGMYVFDDRHSILRAPAQVQRVKNVIDSIETLINAIGNN